MDETWETDFALSNYQYLCFTYYQIDRMKTKGNFLKTWRPKSCSYNGYVNKIVNVIQYASYIQYAHYKKQY